MDYGCIPPNSVVCDVNMDGVTYHRINGDPVTATVMFCNRQVVMTANKTFILVKPSRFTKLRTWLKAHLLPNTSCALPPKPLPATTVLRCACAGCGRRIPQRELVALIAPPKCPECGSILRAWERTPPSLFACFRAWYQLRQWNRRKAKLNRQP
jgi:hypothetical protein